MVPKEVGAKPEIGGDVQIKAAIERPGGFRTNFAELLRSKKDLRNETAFDLLLQSFSYRGRPVDRVTGGGVGKIQKQLPKIGRFKSTSCRGPHLKPFRNPISGGKFWAKLGLVIAVMIESQAGRKLKNAGCWAPALLCVSEARRYLRVRGVSLG